VPSTPKSSRKRVKFRKRRDGPCEVCGHRGCPACSETELFKSLGVREYEMIEESKIWILLDQVHGAIKADMISLRTKPNKDTARAFSRSVNKLMLVFEEICRRRVD